MDDCDGTGHVPTLDELFKCPDPLSPAQVGVSRPHSLQGEVIVLAKDFQLSESQYNLLSKGLSFISTTTMGREEKFQFQLDTQNYHRKI